MLLSSKIKFSLLVFLIGLLSALHAHAATFELALEKDIANAAEDVAILATINSEGQDINTAQATITFPANLLSVTKIDYTGSIFTFWLEEPSFDNDKGTISFVGGSTSGFNGSSLKLLRIAFKVKGSGTGKLGINNGAITASDGTGSNVYNTSKGLDINIPSSAEFQAVKLERAREAATVAKELPSRIGLSIPFYPDQTRWNNRSASFKASWNITSDTTRAAVALNKSSNFTPEASAEALSGSKVFPALADGVWYLHLRLENNIGWSSTLHYRIAVDTMPPSAFKITSNEGFKTGEPKPTINFASSDLNSGINNYIIHLDGNVVATTNATKYQFPPLLPGVHRLVVSAVDKAGNSISESESLEILPITSPIISYVSGSVIANEGGINAGGTSEKGTDVVVQVENSQKQIVAEQVATVDGNGNWNIFINKAFNTGDYHLLATARNKNMASSFPVVSDTINVKERPMLVLGSLEITETWFFIYLIFILLVSFGGGYFTYYHWRGKLGRRVTIAQRDVLNIFNNTEKDIDKLLDTCKEGSFDEFKLAEAGYTLKKIKENLEKSRHYVIDNIREINN